MNHNHDDHRSSSALLFLLSFSTVPEETSNKLAHKPAPSKGYQLNLLKDVEWTPFGRSIWVFPRIGVGPPNHPYLYRVFHYKPSILGYPYFWKHPFYNKENDHFTTLTLPAARTFPSRISLFQDLWHLRRRIPAKVKIVQTWDLSIKLLLV